MTPMQELIRLLLAIPVSLFLTTQAVILVVCIPSVYSMLPEGRSRRYRAVNFMRRWGTPLSTLSIVLVLATFGMAQHDVYAATLYLVLCFGTATLATNSILAKRLEGRLWMTREHWDPSYEAISHTT